MLIGGSCGGRFSRPIQGTTCYENRILQNGEHAYFYQDCKFCLENNIYLIVNIDSYLTNSRWRPTNLELRNFVIDTKNRLRSLGSNKSNTRFTVDNESDEYCDFNYYMNIVRVIHDALSGEFDLGAGSSYAVGAIGGEAVHTLTHAELPTTVATRGDTYYSGSSVGSGYANRGFSKTNLPGGGTAHENRPPYYALCFIVKE